MLTEIWLFIGISVGTLAFSRYSYEVAARIGVSMLWREGLVREVVKHFVELKKACSGKYRLIYITDGMGWLKLAKSVKSMIEFEMEEQKIEPSPVMFLMNLEMFRQNIELIKSEMR